MSGWRPSPRRFRGYGAAVENAERPRRRRPRGPPNGRAGRHGPPGRFPGWRFRRCRSPRPARRRGPAPADRRGRARRAAASWRSSTAKVAPRRRSSRVSPTQSSGFRPARDRRRGLARRPARRPRRGRGGARCGRRAPRRSRRRRAGARRRRRCGRPSSSGWRSWPPTPMPLPASASTTAGSRGRRGRRATSAGRRAAPRRSFRQSASASPAHQVHLPVAGDERPAGAGRSADRGSSGGTWPGRRCRRRAPRRPAAPGRRGTRARRRRRSRRGRSCRPPRPGAPRRPSRRRRSG